MIVSTKKSLFNIICDSKNKVVAIIYILKDSFLIFIYACKCVCEANVYSCHQRPADGVGWVGAEVIDRVPSHVGAGNCMQAVTAHTFNPSTSESLQVRGQPGLHSTSQDSQGYRVKTSLRGRGRGKEEVGEWKEMSACCYGMRT